MCPINQAHRVNLDNIDELLIGLSVNALIEKSVVRFLLKAEAVVQIHALLCLLLIQMLAALRRRRFSRVMEDTLLLKVR